MHFSLSTYQPPDFSASPLDSAPPARLEPAPKDGVAPDQYHATSIYPEYFKIDDQWLLAKESRMDGVAIYEHGQIEVREFRSIRQGDLVVVGRSEDGREGIFVHANGFPRPATAPGDTFIFRQGRSRETAFSMDYDFIYDLLRHEQKHGHITWVLGPACSFDADAREAFSGLIRHGYVDALLSGNALAVHDLEAAWFQTALGQDIYTQEARKHGHYHHLDTINRVRRHGTIEQFIASEQISDGIIYQCVQKRVPLVLVGSVRDDGPLPEVYADVYLGQDAMRALTSQATTVICLASTLHAIATGNITPSYRVLPDGTIREVYFYIVDISEFTINKLTDRGSLSSRGIVTNVQDFLVHLANGLHVLP
jgi:lysine-ketoglutarate reductase/saccharopine dehydrogenase-like protein (TIGR00300 family)